VVKYICQPSIRRKLASKVLLSDSRNLPIRMLQEPGNSLCQPSPEGFQVEDHSTIIFEAAEA